MKKLSLTLLCALTGIVLFSSVASAVCPVCTIAIGAGLEGARMLGVKDVLTGIWAGGLTVSLIGWTANYMRKKNITNPIWYVLNAVVYVALLASVYFSLHRAQLLSGGITACGALTNFCWGLSLARLRLS